MAFLRANEQVADHPFIPRSLLLEEPWGEVWRAERTEDRRKLLVLIFSTPDGDELFEEAAGHLRHWEGVAKGIVAPNLLKIFDLNDSAMPYLILPDPGGPTLREFVNAHPEGEPVALEDQGRIALSLANIALQTETYDLAPSALTPDLVIQDPEDRDAPWKLIPVAPRTRGQLYLVGGARYFPGVLEGHPDPVKAHSATYAVGLLWLEIFRRDFESDWPEPSEAIHFKGVKFLVEMCLTQERGAYSEPQAVALAIDRWARVQMKQEQQLLDEEAAERRRGPVLNWILVNVKLLQKLGIAAGVVLIVGGISYMLWSTKVFGVFETPLSKMEPLDVVELYFEAILRGHEDAWEFVTPDTAQETNAMIAIISKMEADGEISQWNTYQATVGGKGTERFIDATLYDDEGTAFGTMRIQMGQRANATWNMRKLTFRRLIFS